MNWYKLHKFSWYKLHKFNLYKKAQSQYIDLDRLNANDLNKIANDCGNGIRILDNLKRIFPTGKFNTSLRQLDLLIKEGPSIRFFVLYDDVKNRITEIKRYFEEQPIISSGIKVEGYLQSSGFDFFEYGQFGQKVPNLYKIKDGKFIPAEKTNEVIGLGIFGGSPDNLINLIHWNVLRKIDTQKIKLKYNDNSIYQQIKDKTLGEKLDVNNAVELFKNNVNKITTNKEEQELLFSEFKGWFWSNKSDVEFIQNIENALSDFGEKESEEINKQVQETGRDPWVFYRDMNPKQEGKGKFVINIEDLEPAVMEWGDFPVLVRYQTGRMIYPALKLIEWNKAGPDNDQAYNFFNQMGGIRDLAITG